MTLNMYSSVTLLRHCQFDIDNPVTSIRSETIVRPLERPLPFFFVFNADIKHIYPPG